MIHRGSHTRATSKQAKLHKTVISAGRYVDIIPDVFSISFLPNTSFIARKMIYGEARTGPREHSKHRVIEIQLMVFYAMKIYCKHISGRDMGIFWCQPLISASNRSSGIRRTRPCRQLDPVKVGPWRTRPRRTRPCHSVAGAWPRGHDVELLRVISFS